MLRYATKIIQMNLLTYLIILLCCINNIHVCVFMLLTLDITIDVIVTINIITLI